MKFSFKNRWKLVIACLFTSIMYRVFVTNISSLYTRSVNNNHLRRLDGVNRIASNPTKENTAVLELCPQIPPDLVGSIHVNLTACNSNYINSRYKPAGSGGHFQPAGCRAESSLAVIVAFRDRETHLNIFLNNIIPFLIKQQADFTIFLVEQAPGVTFNRAMLMNIGFVEASRARNFTCFIFHDVDLLPENDYNLYRCGKQPRHLAVANEKFKYTLPYSWYSGGVLGMNKATYLDINGHSNMFFGWGGEDDDMAIRLQSKGYKLVRYPKAVGRYRAIPHGMDKGNDKNPYRNILLRITKDKLHEDGLNSLNYTVVKRQKMHVYTRILVDFKQCPQRILDEAVIGDPKDNHHTG